MCGFQAGTEPPGARWEDYQPLDHAGDNAAGAEGGGKGGHKAAPQQRVSERQGTAARWNLHAGRDRRATQQEGALWEPRAGAPARIRLRVRRGAKRRAGAGAGDRASAISSLAEHLPQQPALTAEADHPDAASR